MADREVALPQGIAGIARCEGLPDGEAGLIGVERPGLVPARHAYVADPFVAGRQVALPLGIAGVARCEGLTDGEAGLIGVGRAREVPLLPANVADPRVVDREVALPQGVAGVARHEGLTDGERDLIGVECARQVPLRRAHVADPGVAYREVALPIGIAGVARREGLGDGEAGLIGVERPRQVPLRRAHVADLAVAGREDSLPRRVAGVARHEGFADGKAGPIGVERAPQISLRQAHIADLGVADREVSLGVRLLRRAGHPQFRRVLHAPVGVERPRGVAGQHMEVADVGQDPDAGAPRRVGNVERRDSDMLRRSLFEGRDGGRVPEPGALHAGPGGQRAGLRHGALDEDGADSLGRLAVHRDRLVETRRRLREGAEGQGLLRLGPEPRDSLVRRGEGAQLLPGLDERTRRLGELRAALLRRQVAQPVSDQRAVERRQRHLVISRDPLHFIAQGRRHVGHGEQQPLAFGQVALSGGEEQRRQAAFHIGKLCPAGQVVDLLLHERQHRADFEPVRGQVFRQRRRERRVPAVPVRRRLAGCRRKGEQHVLRPADAAQARLRFGHHLGGQRCRAAPGVRRRQAEWVVAAGIDYDQADIGRRLDRLAQFFQRQACVLQPLQRGRIGIRRQQPVLAADLDAMAGEKNQRHVGAGRLIAKIRKGAAHPHQVAVGLEENLEAERRQRVFDGAGVVDGVGERPQRRVAIGAEDKRHATLGQRGGRDESREDDGKQNAQHDTCPRKCSCNPP